jgi:murein DD-endopeptidase MepM/ murein hydrolase activator NlpD
VTFRGLLLVVVLIACIGGGAFTWYRAEGDAPQVDAPQSIVVGREVAALALQASDDRSGMREIRVFIATPQREVAVGQRSFPGSMALGGRSPGLPETLELEIDANALGLEEGSATLVVSARDWSWRDTFLGNETRLEIPLRVDLSAPRIQVASGLTYVKRGGSGMVTYSLGEAVERDGVAVGGVFFRGFPAPGGNDRQRIAVFAVPTDAPPEPAIDVIAEDAAGNVGRATWPVVLKERTLPKDDINLPQRFLQNKVRNLASATGIQQDDLEAAFDEINTRIRAENETRIRAIIRETAAEPLWSGPFAQMLGSKVTSRFAEQRSYYVSGKQISSATHFGYDLASTAGAAITASNAGRVVFADDLGIYGNCVIVDHGLAVFTLYAHLNRIDIAVGDAVEKEAPLGISGATGLAGGDHLHFAILVGNEYVDPLEWWDPLWVRTHIDNNLSP